MLTFAERLHDDERFVLTARPHWLVLVPPVLIGFVIGFGSMMLISVVPGGFLQAPIRALVTLAGLAGIAFWSVLPVVRWAGTRLTVTTERVLHRTSLLRDHVVELPVARVVDVRVAQSLAQRGVGTGDVEILPAHGRVPLRLRQIPDPFGIQDTILRLRDGA